ncbi:MAG: endonuclease/exonuclease/phosphatase family protein [Psychroflexus sp.]
MFWQFFLIGFQILMFIAAFITLLDINHWVVRIFDFPKFQLWVLTFVSAILGLLFFDFQLNSTIISTILIFLSLAFHTYKVLPYSIFHSKEVLKSDNSNNSSISLMASNVLMSNTNYDKLIQLVNKHQPDVLLTLESDQKWENALKPLEKNYPYVTKIPQDNLYGMHFYSKLKTQNLEVKYLISQEIPSIETDLILDSGEKIKVFCLHPKPPSPTEAETSTNRDAELLVVGKKINKKNRSTIVFGDLNDVAWSNSTRLFRKISGLLDPRIGRGNFSTFHAEYRLLRWPLDHLFHSHDFFLNEIKVLPSIGSDHFPIYASLKYHPKAEEIQEEPNADTEEHELANKKIDAAV